MQFGIEKDFRMRWSPTPKNRGRSKKTQGRRALKIGGGILAVGRYLQGDSAPPPPPPRGRGTGKGESGLQPPPEWLAGGALNIRCYCLVYYIATESGFSCLAM